MAMMLWPKENNVKKMKPQVKTEIVVPLSKKGCRLYENAAYLFGHPGVWGVRTMCPFLSMHEKGSFRAQCMRFQKGLRAVRRDRDEPPYDFDRCAECKRSLTGLRVETVEGATT